MICGTKKMGKMGKLLRKFAEYQTIRGKAILDTPSESSEEESELLERDSNSQLDSELRNIPKAKNTTDRVRSIIR